MSLRNPAFPLDSQPFNSLQDTFNPCLEDEPLLKQTLWYQPLSAKSGGALELIVFWK